MDGIDFAKAFELSDFDAFEDEHITPLIPLQEYEFICVKCTMIHHSSERAFMLAESGICVACARVGIVVDADPIATGSGRAAG